MEERVGKPPVGRPRSGTIGATGLPQGVRRGGGYHSEGYFSSDQDDEAPRRTGEGLVNCAYLENFSITINIRNNIKSIFLG